LRPTASQADGVLHDTPENTPLPVGLGAACVLQATPFQAIASGWLISDRPPLVNAPTAVHAAAEAQETPFSWLDPGPGFGTLWSAQAAPFQRSASGATPAATMTWPTAVQATAEVHDTAARDPPPGTAPVGRPGVGRIVQLTPFQRSASGPPRPDPTAMHDDGAVHATPFSSLPELPATAAALWSDQRLPSQPTANGCTPASPVY
jgi:hypothetical protein